SRSSAAAVVDGLSVTHTTELPNKPRPPRSGSAAPSSFTGSGWLGGGNRAARSADTAVVSSACSIRRSVAASAAAAGGDIEVGTASAGDRYMGRRSVTRDRPHGPTLLRVTR